MSAASVSLVRDQATARLKEIEHRIEAADWEAATALARTVGREAVEAGQLRTALKAGEYLDILEDYEMAALVLFEAGRLRRPSPIPEWDGTSSRDRTLVVVQRIGHVGAAIRLGRLIPLAAQRVGRCIVFAERRLLPLFKRSFPNVDVRESMPDGVDCCAEADVVASYETLRRHLVPEHAMRTAELIPLRPDVTVVAELRRKYRQSGQPLVGICWASTNRNKDTPDLDDWAEFMRSLPTTFVSLQYGDVGEDVGLLRAMSGAEFLYDETVDPLANLDRFAAQVSAVDLVVSISNTGAHMAGALNVPVHVILDDKAHLVWPARTDRTPWYSSATLTRKARRRWPQVFADVRRRLRLPWLPG